MEAAITGEKRKGEEFSPPFLLRQAAADSIAFFAQQNIPKFASAHFDFSPLDDANPAIIRGHGSRFAF